ncbi:uncharacterized protein NEPG_02350 [Nematocida parisii ERTm1]|uniref:uncharacterized protein n=1 Tax=Nematocida parisii (strain ERTm1 / ATCC PRA-289) TaxID=881290 RepID=UPI000264B269|nr:uncharacterized protein NEPG_02350 [Nematocida parisii ERTm1]KAI5127746.1 hypothetical protein NEPAR03_1085 [Nematocida parisii]EIJ92951.1 hypothetical protein NEPG_02350 [Nematocida parisii ERTm1]KAI5128884.1 hypothetical protein NEPAR08_1371 [Nematocida parisii]KAI5141587.1 hypothetical protein NEPAR04_1077 [Nematocida parisii]KAI5144054.1 hypothetical protein NEPAR07_1031 [Nematocida parisii]|eukprot:XP_013060177.1 hypothetical protein NEPG_02350 [Nematocida parisii ERTm1]
MNRNSFINHQLPTHIKTIGLIKKNNNIDLEEMQKKSPTRNTECVPSEKQKTNFLSNTSVPSSVHQEENTKMPYSPNGNVKYPVYNTIASKNIDNIYDTPEHQEISSFEDNNSNEHVIVDHPIPQEESSILLLENESAVANKDSEQQNNREQTFRLVFLYSRTNYIIIHFKRVFGMINNPKVCFFGISLLLILTMYIVRLVSMNSFHELAYKAKPTDGTVYNKVVKYIQVADFLLTSIMYFVVFGIRNYRFVIEIFKWVIIVANVIFIGLSLYWLNIDLDILLHIGSIIKALYDISCIFVINTIFGYVVRRNVLIYQTVVFFSINYMLFLCGSYQFWKITREDENEILQKIVNYISEASSSALNSGKLWAAENSLVDKSTTKMYAQTVDKYIYIITTYKIVLCISSVLFITCYRVLLQIKSKNNEIDNSEKKFNISLVRTTGALLCIEFLKTMSWYVILNILLLRIKNVLDAF